MRFALLCDDPAVGPLVDAFCSQMAEHQLVSAVRINQLSEQLLFGRTGIRHLDHWEDLLTSREIDAVIIGGDHPQVLEGARQLAAAGIPILFVPHAVHGSTFIYELSLIRDDNHVALCPLFWHRYDAATAGLKTMLNDGRLGRVQVLQLDRTIASDPAGPAIPQTSMDAELLHDVELIRWLIGDYNQVTAIRSGVTHDGVLMQNVVLAGRSLPEASWTARSGGSPAWRLIVRGENGEAELLRDESPYCWVCQFAGERIAGDIRDTAQKSIEACATSLGQPTSPTADADWGELIKCFETVDASQRSVRRKRTIELHFEPMSERAIFKTQMTAIGCGLLIGTFLLTLCYLGLASVVPLPPYVLIILRTLVFAPLVAFLVAQILLPLTRPSSNENS